jgi:Signal transduction histidine kinase involved in nitrogen fixation and metabolism regulation
MVRISVDEQVGGLIVTLDDVTALLQAQRLAAWSDVARRVAHEIRNPLTPIQLATERMKRRFRPDAEGSAQEVFDRCTETIIRQVEDIRRMVDEFSTFARMPKPVMKDDNLTEVVEQAIFLQQVANPDIEFDLNLPEQAIMVPLDGRLISQAVINVVKNSIEALRGHDDDESKRAEVMKISVFTDVTDDKVSLVIRDSGSGFPEELISRLKEPYVTTRQKGTGLGLAIVDRIMKDHGGQLELFNAPNGGACVSMSFLREATKKGTEA